MSLLAASSRAACGCAPAAPSACAPPSGAPLSSVCSPRHFDSSGPPDGAPADGVGSDGWSTRPASTSHWPLCIALSIDRKRCSSSFCFVAKKLPSDAIAGLHSTAGIHAHQLARRRLELLPLRHVVRRHERSRRGRLLGDVELSRQLLAQRHQRHTRRRRRRRVAQQTHVEAVPARRVPDRVQRQLIHKRRAVLPHVRDAHQRRHLVTNRGHERLQRTALRLRPLQEAAVAPHRLARRPPRQRRERRVRVHDWKHRHVHVDDNRRVRRAVKHHAQHSRPALPCRRWDARPEHRAEGLQLRARPSARRRKRWWRRRRLHRDLARKHHDQLAHLLSRLFDRCHSRLRRKRRLAPRARVRLHPRQVELEADAEAPPAERVAHVSHRQQVLERLAALAVVEQHRLRVLPLTQRVEQVLPVLRVGARSLKEAAVAPLAVFLVVARRVDELLVHKHQREPRNLRV
eukprot:7391956-Prymnesium_polylepis.1